MPVWFIGYMKRTLASVFVDDGYPEASDYDTNVAFYDPSVRGSYEQALEALGLKPTEPTWTIHGIEERPRFRLAQRETRNTDSSASSSTGRHGVLGHWLDLLHSR